MAVVSRTKRARKEVVNAELLRRCLRWVIDDALFERVPMHGNTLWKAADLVVLAILWVWSDHATLTGAFTRAYHVALSLFGAAAVTTYQGLTKALITWTDTLLPLLWQRLHQRMEQCAGPHWRLGRWLPLAVDGSRVSTPRTKSNEQAYAAAHYGRGKTARSRRKWSNKRRRSKKLSQPVRPQIWLTLLWHMGLALPWMWQIGPSTASERDHFLQLLRGHRFPEDTLFCGDAGFIGYDLWQTILGSGHQLLIRVGANVRLLRGLGHVRGQGEIVHCWPDKALRQGQPPLVLRLLHFQGPRGKVYVVTSLLSEQDLSAAQACQLYRLRWGIELQFRAFKQTYRRGTLRSRTADGAAVELQWSLLGLWLVELFAVKEQLRLALAPGQTSVALALEVIRDLMREAAQPTSLQRFRHRWGAAVRDTYRRHSSKQARYRSSRKDPPSAKRPKVVQASRRQREALRELQWTLPGSC